MKVYRKKKKSPRDSSSRSLQIRNTNYIHFCQKWTYLVTALGTKDYINYHDVGLNVARTVLFYVTFLITTYLINCIHIFNYILYYRVFIVFLLYSYTLYLYIYICNCKLDVIQPMAVMFLVNKTIYLSIYLSIYNDNWVIERWGS